MNTVQNVEPATPESIWAILRELAVSQAETDRRIKETDRILSEKQAETDRQMKETDRQMKESGRRMDKIFSKMSSWDYNHGQFAEEYFLNCNAKDSSEAIQRLIFIRLCVIPEISCTFVARN